MFPPEIEAEIADLGARYGAPGRVVSDLAPWWPFDPLNRSDRYGEVCMVIRRRSGLLLTAIKTYYPPGCYRLLTGGVGHGERIIDALLREVDEETGLDVVVRRFLVAVEYRYTAQAGGEVGSFATFAFLLDEVGGTLEVRDPDERVADFREIAVADLPALADHLESQADGADPQIGGSWADWGRFRAVAHRAVHAALSGGAL
jgi:NAD+ diphosphatase